MLGWRVRFAAKTFVPFFMKSGTKKCRGEEALVLTTEYTEAGEPILKNTERSSVYSVWERKRPFCVFCGKKIAADGLTPSLTNGFD